MTVVVTLFAAVGVSVLGKVCRTCLRSVFALGSQLLGGLVTLSVDTDLDQPGLCKVFAFGG